MRKKFVIVLLCFVLPSQALAFWALVPSAIRAAMSYIVPSTTTVLGLGQDYVEFMAQRAPGTMHPNFRTFYENTRLARIRLRRSFVVSSAVTAGGLLIGEILGYSDPPPSSGTTLVCYGLGNLASLLGNQTYSSASAIQSAAEAAVAASAASDPLPPIWDAWTEYQSSPGVFFARESRAYMNGGYGSEFLYQYRCEYRQNQPVDLDVFDAMLNDLRNSPNAAEANRKARDIVHRLKDFVANHPNEPLPEDLIMSIDPHNLNGLLLDPYSQTVHTYSTDPYGNLTVDGNPVPVLDGLATYTDANGKRHVLQVGADGVIYDNGVPIDPTVGYESSRLQVSTKLDGSKTVTQTIKGANGTTVQETTTYDPYGNIISKSQDVAGSTASGTSQSVQSQQPDQQADPGAWYGFGDRLGRSLRGSFAPLMASGSEDCWDSQYLGMHCLSEGDQSGQWTSYIRNFMGFLGSMLMILLPIYAAVRF